MFCSSAFRTLDVIYHYYQYHHFLFFSCQGKIFIGVNCDTNDAKAVKLSSTISGGKRSYECSCEGTLTTGEPMMYCYMHYWECQI